jgi:glycine/D-amino acid oxidase-like deaminating enzyme
MTFREENFWLTTLPAPAPEETPPLPETVDVAVIGGGFTGLSAARTLAQGGARVAVLEDVRPGWGASSRNGGMVLTGLKLGPATLIARYGRERARRLFAASLAAITLVEQIVAEENIACDFARCGHLETASKPAHYAHFQHSAELTAKEFNHPLRVIPKHELNAEIGSLIYHGGLVDEVSAGVNPARYVAGLAAAARRAGALLASQTPVTQIERRNGRYHVVTGRGSLTAEKVFVATSGYTGAATPALRKKIVPIGSFIIVTDPLPEALARDISPRNRMIFDSKNFLYYFRLTPDRRMLFGGRAAFFPETATSSAVRDSAPILRAGMMTVYPQLKDVAVKFVWGGTLDFAFDLMPHAGQLDGLYYALGYAGHGVALATYLGAQMARAMLGEPVDNPFAETPFPGAPLGLYDGRPWFLPFAEVWYRFLDWVS